MHNESKVEALVPKTEAIDRVLSMLRKRIESAFANGQRVRMDAREGMRPMKVSTSLRFASHPYFSQKPEPDGSFDLHLWIEPLPEGSIVNDQTQRTEGAISAETKAAEES